MTILDRLQALTGPDLEVDAMIWAHINNYDVQRDGPSLFGSNRDRPHNTQLLGFWTPNGSFNVLRGADGTATIPHFTGSIDAAMTLTPEIEKPHFPWLAVKSNNPNNPIGCRCEMWLDNVQNFRGRGATIAIAVCIAALRARGVE